ncbi:glycosyltransferase [Morganella psychrotolerans]|nr:glycosyltransferase [Morganella psychrotolerans]
MEKKTNKNLDIIVLMSVYKNDNPNWVAESINSILNQKEKFFHILLSVDGEIPPPLQDKIETLKNSNMTIFYHKKNRGLAFRLNQMIDYALIKYFNFCYFARMDCDDIATVDRFIIQSTYLDNNNDIDVVGSDVIEINEFGCEISYKKMEKDHGLILKNIIKKCPLNHPTVMIRKEIFENGYRYKSELKNTQDYMLWVDLLAAGFKFSNINKPLLYFRVDKNFYNRRGMKKAFNDLKIRIAAMRKLKCFSCSNLSHATLLCILRISPVFIKKIAYKVFR